MFPDSFYKEKSITTKHERIKQTQRAVFCVVEPKTVCSEENLGVEL